MSDFLVRFSRWVEKGDHRPAYVVRSYRSMPEAHAACHNRGDGVPLAYREPELWTPPIDTCQCPESIGRPARYHSTFDRGALPAPIYFPLDNFKHSLTLFSKSFSSFPRGTYSLSGPGTMGFSPYLAPPSRVLGPGPPLRTLLKTIIQMKKLPDSKAGLFPVHSPLLRKSLFTYGNLFTNYPSLNDKFNWTSRDVTGNEPSTSPQSENSSDHSISRSNSATMPQCHCATVPWCLGALMLWCHGSLVPRCLATMGPWCHGAMVP
ncbi:hypothetical protein BC332_33157 [Capsicum chinense]|nr:hypothetical protein BC332_33157 [Capsicum chinense]